jgi:alkanesulfonate monooxygenase SsuD/methylene tetrahydromethanopterin reductase-like flavin-dependent oxidoreductase (luciferase family)
VRRFSANAFELGLFSFNVAGGLTQTEHEIWDASWENNLTVARLAEAAGLEFLLPLGRWRGLRAPQLETDAEGGTFESLVWAGGILAATERIAVFGTLHVGYVNPVFAAKQVVTAHLIGRGRFGLNVVSGTIAEDYAMMGVPFDDHDARYDYTEEWVHIAKRIWTEREPFDHDGKHFRLRGVLGKPKPYGGRPPMLISAGHSPRGRAFAIREADALFTSFTEIESLEGELRAARGSSSTGAAVPVYGSGHLITRPTAKECDEYYHHLVYELGHWDGVEEQVALRTQHRAVPVKSLQHLRERVISGNGTFCVRGGYDDVARTFKQLHDAGLNGMAVALVDYIADFSALRDEILPRLERLGLRAPA